MVVAKKVSTYSTYGNTAYDLREYNKDDDTNKKNSQNKKHVNKLKLRKQFRLVCVAFLMLCIGTLVVGRYAYMMNLNNQIDQYKKVLADNQSKNDELKIQLMKSDDIKQVEKVATTELNMVRPDSNNIVHINIEQADQGSKVASAETATKPQYFIKKITDFFNW